MMQDLSLIHIFCAVFFVLDALLLRWVKTTGAERFSHLS